MPEIRKQLFLVTKDHPRTPKQLIAQLDKRLEALKTDYVDLIFIHALGDESFSQRSRMAPESASSRKPPRRSASRARRGSSAFRRTTLDGPKILQNAAEGGFVDAIMVQNNPWIAQEDAMNRALDAVHKTGIGLISMKQVAGNMNMNEVARRLPELSQKGLNPYQALLHAIWTDERFSSCCVSMRNTDQVRENTEAARTFVPMKQAEIDRLRDACIAAGPTLCASCDGRCSRAAGTTAELGNLTRFLTYHDHHGYRREARRLYAELTETRHGLEGRGPGGGTRSVPQQARFRLAIAAGRRASRLTWTPYSEGCFPGSRYVLREPLPPNDPRGGAKVGL